METDNTYPINLITTYLAGEASSDDLIFLESWLNADPANREIFREYHRVWLEMEQSKLANTLDIDAEWNDFEGKIGGRRSEVGRRKSEDGERRTEGLFVIHYRQILRIAAILIVIIIPGYFIFRNLNRPVQKQLEASLTLTHGKLPDGTSVTLNKGATLEYPSTFKGNSRIVKLKGEAYFEVKHDEKRPFIVSNNKVQIKDLGTTFYVNTNTGDNSMEVILNSGSVAIYFENHKERSIILAPGEKADINTGSEKIEKDINTDQNYNAWMTQRFIFSNTPLVNIIAELNKVYHSDLRISTPAISYCLVTATFDHQSVESILHVLQATLDLTITSHGTWTDISGNKCN